MVKRPLVSRPRQRRGDNRRLCSLRSNVHTGSAEQTTLFAVKFVDIVMVGHANLISAPQLPGKFQPHQSHEDAVKIMPDGRRFQVRIHAW